MAKFGNTLIVGFVWIAISVGIGIYGSRLSNSPGFLGVVGWVISILGFGFALMSAMHLYRMVRGTMKALKRQKDDPEGFAKAQLDYKNAMQRIEEEN